MNASNKQVLSYFILSLFLGIALVILLNSPIQGNPNSMISREFASQINQEREQLKKNQEMIESLTKEYKKLEKKLNEGVNLLTQTDSEKYYKNRMLMGQETIVGEGVILSIESKKGQNIAFAFDTDRVLLKLVNIARRIGGEAIAVNNQILLHNTGIVLAGNHINVNNVPITPPYEIKIIGNEKTLYRYFTEESVYILTLEKKFDVTVSVTRTRKIEIPKTVGVKEAEYIKEIT